MSGSYSPPGSICGLKYARRAVGAHSDSFEFNRLPEVISPLIVLSLRASARGACQPSSNRMISVSPAATSASRVLPALILGLERCPLAQCAHHTSSLYIVCRSSSRHTAAVEQYDLAASLGSRSNDPVYKELEIMVGLCAMLSDL